MHRDRLSTARDSKVSIHMAEHRKIPSAKMKAPSLDNKQQSGEMYMLYGCRLVNRGQAVMKSWHNYDSTTMQNGKQERGQGSCNTATAL